MSLTNPNLPVTEERLSEFYQSILPYLGGMPEAICNKFDKANMYSTTEKIVGCWTDGRPIYQKTVDCGTLPNASSSPYHVEKIINHNISNIGTIIRIYGIATNNSGVGIEMLDVNISHTDVSKVENGIRAVVTSSAVKMTVYNSDRSTYNGYVTIQYTKTTDAANSFKWADENDYSTTEKIVGTWIDGKPVYQKVIKYTPTNLTQNTTAIHIPVGVSVDTPIKCDLMRYHLRFPCFLYDASNDRAAEFIGGNFASYQFRGEQMTSLKNEILLFCGANNGGTILYSYNNKEITAIIQYTKTTD